MQEVVEIKPRISASFYASCPRDFDPHRITAAAGIAPTEIWYCKPFIAVQHPELDKMSWNYELVDLPLIDYTEALEQVIEVFWPRREQLLALAHENNLTLGCMLVPRGESRNFVPQISASIIQKLGDLGASLTISNDRFL